MCIKKIALFGSLLFSIFLLSACSGPTLDTSSSVSYKQTLQKMYEDQKNDDARLLLANSIIIVVTDGKEWNVKDSTQGYNLYDNLAFSGNSGRLMPLNGKNADEILALGYEARKKWVLASIPAKIESIEESIDKLNQKKLRTEQIVETEKMFQIEDVRVTPEEALAAGTNKPLGGVYKFVVTGKANNIGSMPVYGCELDIILTDTKTNTVVYDSNISRIEFKIPVEPNGTQNFSKELSVMNWRAVPYEVDRYTIQYKLKRANATKNDFFSDSGLFSKFDEINLRDYEKELAELTTLLKEFSDSK